MQDSTHIDTYLSEKLNDQQYAAASYVTWHSLILAWAGSWKTRTLTYKIANLIYGHNVDPNRILAVTFTNKAAWEMKERLEKIIEEMKALPKDIDTTTKITWEDSSSSDLPDFDSLLEESANEPPAFIPPIEVPPRQKKDQYQWIGTFHSIFLKILKQDIEALWLGRKKSFVIYDTWDTVSLIKSIIKSKNMKEMVDHKDVKRTISTRKNSWYTPEQAWYHCENQSEEWIFEVYQEYRKQMQASNSLDFDDLLLLPKLLFDAAPEVHQKRQNTFQHILVDEAQDTNTIQFELMKSLLPHKLVDNTEVKTITFIWDDYQSIYRRRGAVMNNFLNLEKRRPTIITFKLETNYRSLPHIVEAWNAIIKKNRVQYDKDVVAHRQWEKHIRVFWFADERDEAVQIIEMIAKLKEEANKNRNDFTILYRTNAQSVPFEHVLIADAIPYKVVWAFKFFERQEVKDILAYLKFLLNPVDSLALKRIINTPSRAIGKTTVENLEALGQQHNTTFANVVMTIWQFEQHIKPAVLKKLSSFKNMMQSMISLSQMSTPADLIDQIIKGIRYEDYLIKQDGKDKAEERMGNIWQLVNMAMKYTDVWLDVLREFMDEVTLMWNVDKWSEEDDVIRLMSVHGSKWLEFPYVFIVGLEEGIFPLPKAKFDDAELEEERRWMYVAITRAQDHLFLSYANSRQQRWQIKYNPTSRFVDEIPEYLVKKYDLSWGWSYHDESASNDRDEGDRVAHKLFWPWRILEVREKICIVKFDNAKFGVRKLEGRWLKEGS